MLCQLLSRNANPMTKRQVVNSQDRSEERPALFFQPWPEKPTAPASRRTHWTVPFVDQKVIRHVGIASTAFVGGVLLTLCKRKAVKVDTTPACRPHCVEQSSDSLSSPQPLQPQQVEHTKRTPGAIVLNGLVLCSMTVRAACKYGKDALKRLRDSPKPDEFLFPLW